MLTYMYLTMADNLTSTFMAGISVLDTCIILGAFYGIYNIVELCKTKGE